MALAKEFALFCALFGPFFVAKWLHDKCVSVWRRVGRRVEQAVIFDGRCYPVVRRIGGAVESMFDRGCGVELAGWIELDGWAADHAANAPAAAILAVIDNESAASAEPTTRRIDIEQNYGSGFCPAGFSMIVPVPRRSPPPSVRVFALTRDGCAAQLAADLPPGRIATVERFALDQPPPG